MRRGACWEAASTEVERELKSMRSFVRVAGAKVVGGPAWRVFEVGSRGPRVGCAAVAHTLHGPLHVNSHAGSSGHVGLGPSVDPRSSGI